MPTPPPTIEENVPLAPLSTLGVGGPARYYTRAADERAVAAAAAWAAGGGLSLLVLGGGSNVVVADEGFPGLVLHMCVRGVRTVSDAETVIVEAGAGESWDDLVSLAVGRGWAGVECLSGIPGFVGASPIQNVGAYGQDVAETILDVQAVDLETGAGITFTHGECGFGYRDSRFKRADAGRYALVRVRYRLRPGAPPAVRYPDLERILAPGGGSLAEVRAAVLEVRRRKSMVLDPGDPCARSVGSFFMNPVIPGSAADEAAAALARAGRLAAGETLPRYPAAGDQVKLPAAWLIEHCGLARGDRRGAVGLSRNHALAIVNYGGATAREVIAFAREVRDRVRDTCGVTLQPEPVLVGVSLS